MHFPWYKTLASYFTDIIVEDRSSEVNPELKVILTRGRLSLCTPKAVYSEAEYYYNFSEVFKKLYFRSKNFDDTLILGLGLGSIPLMLEKIFHVKTRYDIVEIDAVVVQLFDKYVHPGLHSELHIINQDATTFMEMNTKTFELICVDLFIDNEVPPIFEQVTFFDFLKKSLSTNGILIYNRINTTHKDRKLNDQFDQLFIQVFPNRTIYSVGCNLMFIVQ